MVTRLYAPVLAAALGVLPMAAFAMSLGTIGNVDDGGTYDIADQPFFFQTAYSIDGNDADTLSFTFTNNTGTAQSLLMNDDTVNQLTAEFVGGISFQFDSETPLHFAQGETGAGSLSTTLGVGESTVFTVAFGDTIDDYPGEVGSTPRGVTQISFQIDVAAVPVPAAGLMLLTALGGAAALRRRKSA